MQPRSPNHLSIRESICTLPIEDACESHKPDTHVSVVVLTQSGCSKCVRLARPFDSSSKLFAKHGTGFCYLRALIPLLLVMACARLVARNVQPYSRLAHCVLASQMQNQCQLSATSTHVREVGTVECSSLRLRGGTALLCEGALHSVPLSLPKLHHRATARQSSAVCGSFAHCGFTSTAIAANNGSLGTSHKERRLMAFSPVELFSVVADVDSYEEFVPWCKKSCVTRRLEGGKYEADLVVGFQMFKEKYTSVVTVQEPWLVHSEAADSVVFNHLVTRWELRPGPNKTTSWVTFTIDFSFKNMLYAQTASLFFDQVVSKMITAFDKRCCEIYRAAEQQKQIPS
jgi:ribosome-associated toxin RatA of RatAB toxin-antitoxin module